MADKTLERKENFRKEKERKGNERKEMEKLLRSANMESMFQITLIVGPQMDLSLFTVHLQLHSVLLIEPRLFLRVPHFSCILKRFGY